MWTFVALLFVAWLVFKRWKDAVNRRNLLATAIAVAVVPAGNFAQTLALYPPPSGNPGAPFTDANLKLAVMSGLMDDGVIQLGLPEQLAAHVLGRPVDLENEGYAPIEEARDCLSRYPLTPDVLAQTKSLVLDGGNSIYSHVYYFWGGEDDKFDVGDLESIHHCPNLESMEIISMISHVDFKHLVPLMHLRRLDVSVEARNIPALLDLPALAQIRLLGTETYNDVMTPGHPTRQVFETLKARGVAVKVQPMVWEGARALVFQ